MHIRFSKTYKGCQYPRICRICKKLLKWQKRLIISSLIFPMHYKPNTITPKPQMKFKITRCWSFKGRFWRGGLIRVKDSISIQVVRIKDSSKFVIKLKLRNRKKCRLIGRILLWRIRRWIRMICDFNQSIKSSKIF